MHKNENKYRTKEIRGFVGGFQKETPADSKNKNNDLTTFRGFRGFFAPVRC